jgi:hypothetical protein
MRPHFVPICSRDRQRDMTADEFRAMALGFTDATESAHMNHPDFRVGKKIFATLGAPDASYGMVKLTPQQQAFFLQKAARVFSPCNGAWGKQGCTYVFLAAATKSVLRPALAAAYANLATKKTTRPSARP